MVLSYHTHLPKYAPKYNMGACVPLIWALIRMFHTAAHLTLLTSTLLRDEFRSFNAAPEETLQVNILRNQSFPK